MTVGGPDRTKLDPNGRAYALFVPYFCPRGCGAEFDNRRQRAGHLAHCGTGQTYEHLTKPIPHGTAQGYRTHKHRKEDACAECKTAWRAHMARYRAKRGKR